MFGTIIVETTSKCANCKKITVQFENWLMSYNEYKNKYNSNMSVLELCEDCSMVLE